MNVLCDERDQSWGRQPRLTKRRKCGGVRVDPCINGGPRQLRQHSLRCSIPRGHSWGQRPGSGGAFGGTPMTWLENISLYGSGVPVDPTRNKTTRKEGAVDGGVDTSPGDVFFFQSLRASSTLSSAREPQSDNRDAGGVKVTNETSAVGSISGCGLQDD